MIRWYTWRVIGLMAGVLWFLSRGAWGDPQAGLVGRWKLAGDCRDSSGRENHGVNHGVDLSAADGAKFNGIDSYIEVPASEDLKFGKSDFSIAVWVHTEAELDDVLGDILSKYDPASRTGLVLSIVNSAGVTSSQPNYRNLLFGIDAGRADAAWTDCGRPGNCRFVMAMSVWDGHLYVGTYEEGEKEAGHVYRFDGWTTWTECGCPDPANAIGSLAVYEGKLYAGAARYNAGGSALTKSLNWNPGGKVYRYEGGSTWTDCGRLGEANEVIGMAVFQGKLYAAPLYQEGKGLYRYEGGQQWTFCGNSDRRVQPLVVYNGHLYAGSYDGGRFVRYDGPGKWTDLGQVPETTQVYSFAVYQGRLHLCNWPTGSVFVYDAPKNQWTHVGRLGDEKEVMGVAVYNGKMYAGTSLWGRFSATTVPISGPSSGVWIPRRTWFTAVSGPWPSSRDGCLPALFPPDMSSRSRRGSVRPTIVNCPPVGATWPRSRPAVCSSSIWTASVWLPPLRSVRTSMTSPMGRRFESVSASTTTSTARCAMCDSTTGRFPTRKFASWPSEAKINRIAFGTIDF
ncbi:MAG TPA: hypothetical protein PK777_03910 [Thermoguttaceae bacterium]|nr:hypothetical protein [Thermoguttaceae bacterium]